MTGDIVDRRRARHYHWGEVCDGWHLLVTPDLSIIEERVPPGGSETRHLHRHARQFFYILEGIAKLEVEGRMFELGRRQGLQIPPGAAHRLSNDSDTELVFLVVSAPPSHGDRALAATIGDEN